MPSRSPSRLIPSLLCTLALVAASGCGETPAPKAARTDAIGEDVPQACVSADAHARHAAASVACVACHPCGGEIGFTATIRYPQGTTSGGTYTARVGTTPPSCQVGCHSPLGSPAHSVVWVNGELACTACHDVAKLLERKPQHPQVSASATRQECQGCHLMTAHTQGTLAIAGHDAAWVDRASPTFHAFDANQGLNMCQGCHGTSLGGNPAGIPSCASCHNGTVAIAWNCVMCHGDPANQTGAPPKATWGQAGDPNRGGGTLDSVRVGAHTAHVTPSAISPGFSCDRCHVMPTDVIHPNHADAETYAQVVFSGMAVGRNVPAPTWSRTGATCSSTYCHGATMVGGSTPVWTGGAGEGACGTCHGLPPPSPHPGVDTTAGLARCSTCHPTTIDPAGTVVPPSTGGTHLNGTLEAMGHDELWMTPASPDFHAFAVNQNIAGCTGCHGAQLEGGATGISCAGCHDGTRAIAWNCVMCHGGTDNQTGAPPKALWGFAGDLARGGGVADPLRVGAHSKHLGTTLMAPIACETCHVVPAAVLSPSHIDGADSLATVTWSGMATLGGAQPAWSRASGTCASTYCHGNYSGTYVYGYWDWGCDGGEGCMIPLYASYVGGRATPGWSDGPVTCASCHGNPPQTGYWHSGQHGSTDSQRQCQTCHPGATSVGGVGTAITNPTQHVNGIVEVTPRWTSQCFGCH